MADIPIEPLSIAVIGATGVLGRAVVPLLIDRGHSVRAQARDPETAAAIDALAGAEIVAGDILDRASLDPIVKERDAVLHLATAVPRPGEPMDWTLNDRIRREGTANLLAACQGAGVARYIQQSIAMIHCGGDDPDAWIDEDAPAYPNPVTASAVEMEELVAASDLDWRILRGALFYGPGTGREEAWRQAADQGSLVLPGDGSAYISLIHVDDMASAVVAAIESEKPNATYLVADDAPVTYAELFGAIADSRNAAPPAAFGPPGLPSFRVTNRRLKSELGWRPAYPSYQGGII